MLDCAVFVVSKPSVARLLAPYLVAHVGDPARRIFIVPTMYVGLYRFDLPRGVSMRDYPFISEPRWTPRSEYARGVWEVVGGLIQPFDAAIPDVMVAASSICFAADPDASDAANFHVLLSQAVGESAATARHAAIMLRSLDDASIRKALAAGGTTQDDDFIALRESGLAKRFFDYNYIANSLAVMRKALDTAGAFDHGTVSKFALQLLYALRKWGRLKWGDAIARMASWEGTGRYALQGLGMGSAASRVGIVENLCAAGFAVEGEGSVAISAAGLRFLDQLHPDCCDPDLPFRLERWQQEWPESKPKMERYLRTFFGKQKRYRPAGAQ